MTSDTAAGGGQYAQNTYIELRQRRIEQQNIRMEQKIDLIYQLLSNNLPMVQQRANLASMPSAFPFLRSGFMSYPHMHMSNHGEPDGGLPNPSDDFFDEGYASAPLNSPTQQGGYSTSFDLLAREKAAAAQVQQQNYTMPFGFAATQAANAGDKANEDSALSPSDQAHSQV